VQCDSNVRVHACVLETKAVIFQMKATEQYFPMMPLAVRHNVHAVLNFESVGEILRCDH